MDGKNLTPTNFDGINRAKIPATPVADAKPIGQKTEPEFWEGKGSPKPVKEPNQATTKTPVAVEKTEIASPQSEIETDAKLILQRLGLNTPDSTTTVK